MIYGYHRTSTKEQHLDRGITEITTFCKRNNLDIVKIYTDQQTGKNFNRPRYQVLKEDTLREGDTLIITELDRLGRNKRDTMKEIQYYKDHHIRLMVLEIPTTLTDLSENKTAELMIDLVNNLLFEVFTSIAQAELEKKEKRQREGIQAKKERGEWENYGRPKAIEIDSFREAYKQVQDGTKTPTALYRELGLTKATFYRYKKMIDSENE